MKLEQKAIIIWSIIIFFLAYWIRARDEPSASIYLMSIAVTIFLNMMMLSSLRKRLVTTFDLQIRDSVSRITFNPEHYPFLKEKIHFDLEYDEKFDLFCADSRLISTRIAGLSLLEIKKGFDNKIQYVINEWYFAKDEELAPALIKVKKYLRKNIDLEKFYDHFEYELSERKYL